MCTGQPSSSEGGRSRPMKSVVVCPGSWIASTAPATASPRDRKPSHPKLRPTDLPDRLDCNPTSTKTSSELLRALLTDAMDVTSRL
jgi:hypothetical protein